MARNNAINTLQNQNLFTPALTFGGGNTGLTYSYPPRGVYVGVDEFVIVQIDILLTAKGSSTGVAAISNLPFQTNTDVSIVQMRASSVTLDWPTNYYFFGQTTGLSTILSLKQGGSNVAAVDLTDADFSDTSSLLICGVYRCTGVT